MISKQTTRSRERGFSLIELMMVIAVIGVLAAIAYPSYQDSLVKTRRASAQACLSELAQFMERFYTTNMRYNQDTGGTAVALPNLQCRADLNDFYTFSLPAIAQTTYTLQATPKGMQANDTLCKNLTLSYTGAKGETGTGSTQDCWK